MQQVGAAVIIKDRKFLIAKRKPGGSLANKWEFPGGKIEEGETPQEGLERELREEFEIAINVKELIATHAFENNGKQYLLKAFLCDHLSGELTLREHTEIAWIEAPDFTKYDLAPSDKAVVDLIIERAARLIRK